MTEDLIYTRGEQRIDRFFCFPCLAYLSSRVYTTQRYVIAERSGNDAIDISMPLVIWPWLRIWHFAGVRGSWGRQSVFMCDRGSYWFGYTRTELSLEKALRKRRPLHPHIRLVLGLNTKLLLVWV